MNTRHKPDYEMQLMARVLRELSTLTRAGRARVITYWIARAPDMPEVEDANPQQLDIEDVPTMPALRGAA
jgi:hypothetical protein